MKTRWRVGFVAVGVCMACSDAEGDGSGGTSATGPGSGATTSATSGATKAATGAGTNAATSTTSATASTAGAGGSVDSPEWLVGLDLLTWKELPGTAIAQVGAEPGVAAYSGAVYDPVRGNIVINGGGHFDSSDNGVYAVRLRVDAPSAVVLSPPSAERTDSVEYNPDGKPTARHTYWNIQYSPTLGRMMQLGGSSISGSELRSPKVNGFDLATNLWDPPGTYADRPGYVGFAEGGCMDDEGNGYIAADALLKWTAGTPGSWSVFAEYGFSYAHPIRFDSKRRLIVWFGSDISGAATWTLDGTRTDITLSGPGAAVASGGNSWVYVPDRDAFLGIDWSDPSMTVYAIDAATYEVTVLDVAGAAKPPGNTGQVYERFGVAPEIGVVFYVPDTETNTWVFRYR